ncbi:Daunorubicin/doxorubicin resistance ATP-binding protein DrrA [bioreactor metagenome]|uniref:Daunorubicin/doxorubicin resistance ATP-binding protein DrrA n=1 Tax=bioreactor metagenome TaxID=1076179 RepID=A0A645HB19_9ZZZZ
MTVFLTTHYMEEASESDYVIVIDHGQVAAKGTPGKLKTHYASDTLRLHAADEAALCHWMKEQNLDYASSLGAFVIKLRSTAEALPILDQCRSLISSFEVLQGSMDDVFLKITGKELRE